MTEGNGNKILSGEIIIPGVELQKPPEAKTKLKKDLEKLLVRLNRYLPSLQDKREQKYLGKERIQAQETLLELTHNLVEQIGAIQVITNPTEYREAVQNLYQYVLDKKAVLDEKKQNNTMFMLEIGKPISLKEIDDDSGSAKDQKQYREDYDPYFNYILDRLKKMLFD